MIQKPKLRVGFLINSFDISAWEYFMVSKILAFENAEICLVVKKQIQDDPDLLVQRIIKRHKHLLYGLYRRIENKLVKNKDDAFQKKSLLPLVPGIPCIEVKCIGKKHSDYFTEEDINKIKGFDIDVFIRMGFRILRGNILHVPKYGIWSLHHGDNLVNRGGPPGVWEVIEGVATTGVVLQILTEDLDAGIVLYRSWSKTEQFINRNNNRSYWKAASFIPRQLEVLYNAGWESFIADKTKEEPTFYSNRLYTEPVNSLMAIFIIKHTAKILLSKISELFANDQWFLLYNINLKNKMSFSIFRFKKLVSSKDKFWADPFVLSKNDKYYIFIEEFIFKTNKGHIAVLELDKKGNLITTSEVLNKPYHLSYPFIIEYCNELYMIPETNANKTIEIYKCIEFPTKWEFVMNLMENIEAVDTTILYKENRYWLFANIKQHPGASSLDELFLFYSDTLLTTNWKPHPKNPIVSDVRKARPAGAFFNYNGKLYRPSQDSSKQYGYAVIINEVNIITETEYEESTVSNILPAWDKTISRTHTLAYNDGLTVIDSVRKTGII
ncbi:MAG TPA: hypothetical protein VMY77_06340 [Chitinophagaceae bacterium]|nr:hypothetical protein [Chitinophagaceae bacterium]